MQAVFLHLLNTSIATSWLVLAVMLLRFLLRRAPKAITCLLWVLVAVRLVCPFTIESALSLVPSAQTVYVDTVAEDDSDTAEALPTIYVNSGIDILDRSVEPIIESRADAPRSTLSAPALVWLIGAAGLLLYSAISYIALHHKTRERYKLQKGIYLCDRIESPFILGILRPQILIPSTIPKRDIPYILAHELAHLRRCDHWWKPISFLLLSVYWFNPLLWAAYILLCRDIELACDERVIKTMDMTDKKAYTTVLLNCSIPRKMLTACPVAFGEVNVKNRIKAALHYKKPTLWLIITAVVACVAVAVTFLTSPPADTERVNGATNDTADNITLSTAAYTVSVPTLWEDECSWVLNTRNNAISFSHNKSIENTGGWLFSISLQSLPYTPGGRTDYIGTLTNSNSDSYAVVINYPTDVQYPDEYAEQYAALTNHIPDILSSMKAKDGWTFSRVENTSQIFFYDRSTYEYTAPTIQSHHALSESDSDTLRAIMRKQSWSSKYQTDDILIYDGAFLLDDYVYFGYEQSVLSYAHYYCYIDDKDMAVIRSIAVATGESDPLSSVLRNEREFVAENGEETLLKNYRIGGNSPDSTLTVSPCKYTIVDMNADGEDEMVVNISEGYGAYLILRNDNGTVYGYEFEARKFDALKADGTFIQSSGAGDVRCCHLTFSGRSYRVVADAVSNKTSSYYELDGKISSPAEVSAFLSAWYDTMDAAWGNIVYTG